MRLQEQLRLLLEREKGEAPFQRFFERHPYLLLRAFNTSWNHYRVFPQWRLGTQYVADFLIVAGQSGSWRATFIEIESPSARLYLKDGSKSKGLRVAEKQLEDWKCWLESNREFFRQEVVRALEDKPCYGWDVPDLKKPRTYIFDEWRLVIGRRGQSHDEKRQNAKMFSGYEIATYDRFLDLALIADSVKSDESKGSKS